MSVKAILNCILDGYNRFSAVFRSIGHGVAWSLGICIDGKDLTVEAVFGVPLSPDLSRQQVARGQRCDVNVVARQSGTIVNAPSFRSTIIHG